MDKYEYKIRSEEIKTLIGRKKYIEAMEIADTIDWRKVKNINMLCTVSDLYKLNRRYEESREILLLAYERHPGGRMIIYSLCELSIKLDDVVHAVEYYKEFVQTAPRDNGRYVLQYKLYEAQDVTLEERVAVLEELKRREYREKWAYELAYLYHRIGLGTKCVEECDELILWFGEGRYVIKAMELKMLHTQLSPDQQKKYNKAKGIKNAPVREESVSTPAPVDDGMDIEVKPVNVGEYATINLQRELAESMREVLGEEAAAPEMQQTMVYAPAEKPAASPAIDYTTEEIRDFQAELENNELEIYEEDYQTDELDTEETGAYEEYYGTADQDYEEDPSLEYYDMQSQPGALSAVNFQQPPVTYSTVQSRPQPAVYSTVQSRLQPAAYSTVQSRPQPAAYSTVQSRPQPAAYSAVQSRTQQSPHLIRMPQSKQPDFSMEGPGDFTREILSNLMQDTQEEETQEQEQTTYYETTSDQGEVFFEDPDTMELPSPPVEEEPARVVQMSRTSEIPKIIQNSQDTSAVKRAIRKQEEKPEQVQEKEEVQEIVMDQADQGEEPTVADDTDKKSRAVAKDTMQEKNKFDEYLTQEYDGQIRLAVPEDNKVERQITGQISIDDILLEWEKKKRENVEQRAEAIRQRVKQQTGEIFSQFDASTKEGILAELDLMAEESVKKEKAASKKKKAESSPEKKTEESETETTKGADPTDEEILQQSPENNGEQSTASAEEESGKGAEQGITEKVNEEAVKDTVSEKDKQEEEESGSREDREQRKAEPENGKAGRSRRSEISEKSQRPMTAEEKKLFGPFIQTRSTKDQIMDTLDHISLASYTGNVILTGEPGMGSVKLAKNIIKEIQMTDSNFSGRMAKITGQALNNKDMGKTFSRLSNGALIVEGAGNLKGNAVKSMVKLLEQEEQGIIVILEDTKINMNKLLDNHKVLHQNFNLRIDIEAMDNDSLVLFAKKYALEQEYAIDELGVLALYTKISDLQTSEHSVTTKEVKEIVEDAIHHAGRKNMSHFMDILLGKRYDDEDMIILREKDFA